MGLTGGKRRVNKSLKSWVAFVKKVQKEENLSYKDAIHRAKVRKDKGEKWMTGGADITTDNGEVPTDSTATTPVDTTGTSDANTTGTTPERQNGGRRRRSRRARSGRRSRRSRSTRRRR
jgi:hypothetical protein